MRASARVIGIAGGSGSGKTTLCRAIAGSARDVSVLDLDAYYLDRAHLSPAERAVLNYDEPAAFDIELLAEHLRCLADGGTITKPIYSFATHTRIGAERFAPGRLVLVEGLFTLWWEEVRRVCDLTVFVDAPGDLRLLRRIRRDIETRGRSLESVTTQYLETVRPMHERYVEPTRRYAALVVQNEGSVEAALDPLQDALGRLCGGPGGRRDPTVTPSP